jgi:hypothetical protein
MTFIPIVVVFLLDICAELFLGWDKFTVLAFLIGPAFWMACTIEFSAPPWRDKK